MARGRDVRGGFQRAAGAEGVVGQRRRCGATKTGTAGSRRNRRRRGTRWWGDYCAGETVISRQIRGEERPRVGAYSIRGVRGAVYGRVVRRVWRVRGRRVSEGQHTQGKIKE